MAYFTRLDIFAPAMFIVLSACFTVFLYLYTFNPEELEIFQQLKLVMVIYGYVNLCVGFLTGYAILRSFVEDEYLANQRNQEEYVCNLCNARTPLL